MPVKVSLTENDSILLIESTGQLLRREAGWGAERVAEILRQHRVDGILVDSTRIQKQNSPALSGEMISGFIQAIECDVPIAYAQPVCWTESYSEQIRAVVEDIPANARVFVTVQAAHDWLSRTVAGPVSLG
jgi:hypothetical protein